MATIVEATSGGDINQVRALFRDYQAAFLVEPDFQRYLTLQNFEAELSALPHGYAPPEGALLLALHTGAPAGCVAVKKLDQDVCEMKRLFVRPEYRNLQLGRMLVQAIIEKAAALGYRRMRLDSLPSMKRAQDLYRSFGFQEIPPYCQSPVSNAVYMELLI